MRCPTGKRCFKDKIDALWALGRTGGGILPGEKTERRVYGDCKCCPWWHMTSMEEPLKVVEFQLVGSEPDVEEALTRMKTVFAFKKPPGRWTPHPRGVPGHGRVYVNVVLNPVEAPPA